MFLKTKHNEGILWCDIFWKGEGDNLSLVEIISKCNARMAKHVRWKTNYKTNDHCLG